MSGRGRSWSGLGTAIVGCLLVGGALAGCATGPGPTPSEGATASPPVATGGAGTASPGSVLVVLSEPIATTRQVEATVICSTTSAGYEASASQIRALDFEIGFNVHVDGYAGPGEYDRANVSLAVTAGRNTAELGGSPGTPTRIDEHGGSTSVEGRGPNGRWVALALTWTCSQ